MCPICDVGTKLPLLNFVVVPRLATRVLACMELLTLCILSAVAISKHIQYTIRKLVSFYNLRGHKQNNKILNT